MFSYPEGTTATNFAFPDHIPDFLDEVVAAANVDVTEACGGNVQCVFDASQTGDLNIGRETMKINEANVVNRQEASELILVTLFSMMGTKKAGNFTGVSEFLELSFIVCA